jgi:glycosyltransferase involved in cell wall biosynthesis
LAALAKKHRVSLIHASGGPPSVLIHGWLTAQLTGLPFVAELRDPWTLSQLARPASPLHHRAEQVLEKRILSAASRVVVTAEATAVDYRRFLHHLPADHVVVIRNAFEPDRAPLSHWKHQPGRLTLVHFGACYAERRLGDVLRAIALLRDQGRDVSGVTVRNIGRPAAEDVALAAELGLQQQFLTEPALPFAAGMEQLAQADVLLLPGFGEATQFLPGKLYDYMLAGRPVLATVKPSELADIVSQTGIGVFAAPGDVGQHAHWLARALDDPQALYHPNPQALQAFAAQPAAAATVAVWQAALTRA